MASGERGGDLICDAFIEQTHMRQPVESILDLENIILTGEVAERQRDRRTREVKSVVRGITVAGDEAEVVVKVGPSGTLVVVTVYLA